MIEFDVECSTGFIGEGGALHSIFSGRPPSSHAANTNIKKNRRAGVTRFMGADNPRFKDPAIARAYIRNLAMQFDDPEDMFAFLNACDKAQAALAYWLLEANRYECIQQYLFFRGIITERESKAELEGIWQEYCYAAEEFQLVKEKLKIIISKLNVHNPSECVPKLGLGDTQNQPQ